MTTKVLTGRRDRNGYLRISDYAMIGDCRSAALIGADGSIDWLCLPRFDSPSVFGRILDSERGGYWLIRPTAQHDILQRYRGRSNILRTTFTTAHGRANVIDFMPASDERVLEHARPHRHPRLIRVIECLSGEVEFESLLHPAPDYARATTRFRHAGDRLHADSDGHHFCIRSTLKSLQPHTTFTVKGGDAVAFAISCGRAGTCATPKLTVALAEKLLNETANYWWQWVETCAYTGPFQEQVARSALTLKMLTYAPSGAIVAAPTTSLPEKIGSYHNWDYRFTWLRDAAFTLYAFFQLGFSQEASDFFAWLADIGLVPGVRSVPNLYTVTGSAKIPERELPHLEGYKKSQPVRIGNAAVDQLQLDVYGELLDSVYLFARFGGKISRSLWNEIRVVIDLAVRRWMEPDRSIWEPRGPNQHYTYSKLMCWVAVDRGLRIAEKFKLPHPAKEWKSTRRKIHRAITTEGYNDKIGAFTQVFGGETVDAALLRMSQTRFLPDRDPRILSTINAIEKQLGEGATVRRYRRADDDSGAHSQEGGFLMCAFWLADAYAHIGEIDKAQLLFEQLCALGSPLYLFAEEADVVTGDLLGNYPQAFTHLALVGAAVNIERARHRNLGARRSWR